MIEKVHVHMCLRIIPSIKSTARNKTRLFPSPFLISTNRFLILAGAFRNDYVAACSTSLCSATENNVMGGHVTVPCSSKMTQRGTTADWIKFWCVTRLVATKHIRNRYSFLNSRSAIIAVLKTENSLTLWIFIWITVEVNSKKLDLFNK